MATGSIYLPNNYRAAFHCESVVPAHVAQTKAQAYVDRTKKTIYVPGLGNFSPAGPPPAEAPVKKKAPIVSGTAQVGNSLTTTAGTFTGGEGAVTIATVWQTSDTGSGGWKWLAKADSPLELTVENANKFIRSSSTATDSIGQTGSSNSTSVGPVTVEEMNVSDPTVVISDN